MTGEHDGAPTPGDIPTQSAFKELGGLAFGDQPLHDVLNRTAELAKGVMRLRIEASVTLIDGDKPSTPSYTAQLAYDLDQTQYELGHGPCLASAEAGQQVMIADLSSDTRWPDFVDAAQRRGVRSTLSVPLPVQRQVIGALNLYASEPHAFDDETVGIGTRFGEYAAVAIANTKLYTTAAELAKQMAEAMGSRADIEQAKGILMGQRRCSADEAFDILVTLSQTTHRKLREVARFLIAETVPKQ